MPVLAQVYEVVTAVGAAASNAEKSPLTSACVGMVIVELLAAATFGLLYRYVLGNDPRHALGFAGVLMLCAAVTVIRVRNPVGAAPVIPQEPV